MPLRVIGAGFGRTGTLSLHAALEEVGFAPCEHMTNIFDHPGRFALWREAARRKRRGEPIDWEQLLGGYQATVDWPGAYFWEELVTAYPDAKVILTVRDPERWYASTRDTIYTPRRMETASRLTAALLALVGALAPPVRAIARLTDEVIWSGTFDGRFEDKDHAIRVFTDHTAAVTARVPPERLLVYDVKEGWAPLCAFLEVQAPPAQPFPHLNDAAHFQSRVRRQIAYRGALASGAILAAIAALVATRRIARSLG